MTERIVAIVLIVGGLVAAFIRTPHSTPTSAPPRNMVADVPAANDEPSSNPSGGAAEKNTTVIADSSGVAVVSYSRNTPEIKTAPAQSQPASIAVLQFCLPGCEPCIAARPNVERLKQAGFSIFEASGADWQKYGVKGAPTWIVFENGVEVKRAPAITDLESFLKSNRTPMFKSAAATMSADDLTLCPMCGGQGNVCEGAKSYCGRCELCVGARVVQLGKHVRLRPQGGYDLLQAVRPEDFQIEPRNNGNLITHAGKQYMAIDTPRMLTKPGGETVCWNCRGGGKVCSSGTCIVCGVCNGSGRTAGNGASPMAALDTKPAVTFRCDPTSGRGFEVAKNEAVPQTGCTDCKCFPECHCDQCACKSAAAKQVSMKLPEPPAGYISQTVSQMLADSNALRAAAGKAPQPLDSRLCAAAQEQADFLASRHQPRPNRWYSNPTYDFHAHDSNGGPQSRLARAGFSWSGYGENINISLPGHADDCWPSWRNSAPHYSTILKPYSLAGFGEAVTGDGAIYSVAIYADEGSQVAAAAPPGQVSQPVRAAPQIPRRQISQQPYLILPPVDRHPPPLLHSTQTYSSCGPQGCPPRIFRRGRQ